MRTIKRTIILLDDREQVEVKTGRRSVIVMAEYLEGLKETGLVVHFPQALAVHEALSKFSVWSELMPHDVVAMLHSEERELNIPKIGDPEVIAE